MAAVQLSTARRDGGRPRAPPLVLVVALALVAAPFAIGAPTTAEDAAAGAVACPRDPLGVAVCPDLVVDARNLGEAFLDTERFETDDCAVVEGFVEAGERRLLRFGVSTGNAGAGDVALGAPWKRPDLFTWSPCHTHYHLDHYAAYRLWTPDGYAQWVAARAAAPGKSAERVLADHPELEETHVAGLKVGFCLMDVAPLVPHALPRQYHSCMDQGLSAGWADRYAWYLDGQWVDVTGLPPGHYVLEVEVNPARVIEESTYENNAASTLVYLWSEA